MTQFFGRFGGNVQRLATLQVTVEDNFQQASQRLGIFGNRLTSTSAIMTGTFVAAGAAAAGALVNLAASAARAGDEVAKGSDQIGFAVEGYQRWAEVLELAGSNIDVLSRGIGTLQTAQEGALRGVESYTAQFEALNVSIARANGELLTNQELVESIATSVLADDAVSQEERLAIGRLFGARAGRQFAGALENIGSGERLQQQLASATVFFSEEQARAAEDFQDAMLLLNQQFQLATVSVGNELVPALTSLIETTTPLIAPAVGAITASGGNPFTLAGQLGGLLGGAVRDRFADPAVVPVVRPDGTVVSPRTVDTGGGEFGNLPYQPFTGRIATGTGRNEFEQNQRETTDAIREGSALQLNAIQILEQVNSSLQTQTWDEMLAEIEAERAENQQNWASGLGLLDALVEVGNRQNVAAGLSPVNRFSSQFGRFVNPLGAARTAQQQAAFDAGVWLNPVTGRYEPIPRSGGGPRFTDGSDRNDFAGRGSNYPIYNPVSGSYDRDYGYYDPTTGEPVLNPDFQFPGPASPTVDPADFRSQDRITVNLTVGDEQITRAFERASGRGATGSIATRDDVYSVRTG